MPANIFYFDWEVSLQSWIQQFMGPFLSSIASLMTQLGSETLLAALVSFVYWCYDKKFGKYIGINVAVGLVWNPLIKNVVLRKRPYMVHENIKCLKAVDPEADIMDIAAQGYSFPSAHSSNAALIYGSLPAYDRKHKWLLPLAVALPLIVGLSRVMLGAHYVTDVACGWILGLFIVMFVPFLHRVIKKEKVFYILMLASGIPGFFFCKSNDFFTGYGMMIGFFAGFMFEEKYVRFEKTSNPLECVIRVVPGLLLFLALNAVLKLPFSAEFLENGSLIAFSIRTIRYAIVCFVSIGIYPLFFKYTAKLAERKK